MKSDLNEKILLFFFSKIKGLGAANLWRLIKQCENCHNLYEAICEDSPDINQRIKDLIRNKQEDTFFWRQVKRAFYEIQENYLTILDENYPTLLKNIYDPPLFLFYRGNIELLKSSKIITIVGSRTVTAYHQNATEKIIASFTNTPLVIASGMALGIDALSHQAALNNNLKTIAVLGSGLNEKVLYPQANIKLSQKILENKGLLISEYPENTQAKLYHFPKRNRILAGLSQATIVISGATKSGTLITAQVALDENREVYALPGNINMRLSQGPNSLIADGANILFSADSIFKLYNLKNKSKKVKIYFNNQLEAKIYDLIQNEALTLEQLSQQLGISLAETSVSVSQMEIQGILKINQFGQVEII